MMTGQQWRTNMSGIKQIIASIEKLHGGEREQRSKYDSFTAWQLRERAKAQGREPSILLKQSVDDPHDPQEIA